MLAPIAIMTTNPVASAMHFGRDPCAPIVRRFPHSKTLFDSMSAKVSIFQRSSNDVQLFTIEAINGSLPIDDETIKGVFKATEDLFEYGSLFKTLWNLKNCPVPTPSIVYRCLTWAIGHKRDLDRLNIQMGIVLPVDRPVILNVVNAVLRAFGPRCPIRATSSLEDAEAFLEVAAAPLPASGAVGK